MKNEEIPQGGHDFVFGEENFDDLFVGGAYPLEHIEGQLVRGRIDTF